VPDSNRVAVTVELRGATISLPFQLPQIDAVNQAYDAVYVEEALIQILPTVTRMVQAISGDIRQSPTCPPEVKNRGFQIGQRSENGSEAPE